MKEDRFKEWKPPEMEHGVRTKWHWIPFHPDKIVIGKDVDIGALTLLFGHHGIVIEEDAELGAGCILYTLNTEELSKPKEDQNPYITKGKITIKKGACIGAHTIIFPNVVIKEKEYINAKSIVYINRRGERIIK